ncbi:hypothetical protein BP5796_09371 [Coleophoma crateriformis]|uniref:Xylanolytic transcriptional activator regulatory domain-containing protein n=1 Tax=Coleophoma crateriformis TaxID=565419 RepID=A0A3D8QXU9_9HELO|nr:hypothetical protein BP5796_09371 [Coleophoma crateriformis]
MFATLLEYYTNCIDESSASFACRSDDTPPSESLASTQSILFGSISTEPTEVHTEVHETRWKGFTIIDPLTNSTIHYGPSSILTFVERIVACLHSEGHKHISASSINPKPESATSVLSSGNIPKFSGFPRRQEELFIQLFWQTYHGIVPAICEKDFREHFDSLWLGSTSKVERDSSPLVDIVLAICIKYGRSFTQAPCLHYDVSDTIFASVAYFRRCQIALMDQWESPTLMTVQCYAFVVFYLHEAAWTNMAYAALGTAVGLAKTIGLHLEPPNHLSRQERELRKRIWWLLYIMDTRISIELSRPWAISEIYISLPAQDQELSQLEFPELSASSEHITCLDSHVQEIRLFQATRIVYTSFYSGINDTFPSDNKNIYEGMAHLELFAGRLAKCMEPLHNWVRDLPEGLKNKRANGGRPLSADRTLVIKDVTAPQWLERQRVTLELLYHNTVIAFHRQFISFSPPSSITPLANMHALAALNHSITVTYLVQAIQVDFNIFSTLFEACKVLWQASLTMLAYTLPYPLSPETKATHAAIACAVLVFDVWSSHCPAAVRCAAVLRDLEPIFKWRLRNVLAT